MSKSLSPVIKWSGSKRKIALNLSKLLPSDGRYFEPFIGGGAVLGALGPRESTASDVIPELVDLWLAIRDKPEALADSYENDWKSLQLVGHTHFYEVRDRFNQNRRPEDLLFLSRTCVNGLIRFNKMGGFNNSFHHTRPGISPLTLREVIHDWSVRVSKTKFIATDYEETLREAKAGDTVYLDPPYAATKGRYLPNSMDLDRFWSVLEQLNKRGVYWVLSYDGHAGDRDYSSALARPTELAKRRMMVRVGSSPFPRVMNGRVDDVTESVFMNFDPDEGVETNLFNVVYDELSGGMSK